MASALNNSSPNSLPELAEQTIIGTYEYPYVVLNDNMEVVYIRGRLQTYADLSEGLLNISILKFLNQSLHSEVYSLFYKVQKEGLPQKGNVVRFTAANQTLQVRLHVRPMINNGDMPDKFYLLIFEAVDIPMFSPDDLSDETNDTQSAQLQILALREELQVAHEHLQSYFEEVEISRSEQQAYVEELQSVTEEFKSVNEELESSLEETQSLNEELEMTIADLNRANEALLAKEQELLAEQARLRASEAKLKEAEKIAKIGHWRYDIQTGQVTWSEGMRQIYEWSQEEEVTLEKILEHLYDDPPQKGQEVLEQGIQSGKNFRLDTTIRTPNFKIKYISSLNRPVKDKQGQVTGLHGISMDVTELREKERQLRESDRYLKNAQKWPASVAGCGICARLNCPPRKNSMKFMNWMTPARYSRCQTCTSLCSPRRDRRYRSRSVKLYNNTPGLA
ncbi:MAG: hypothetical protein HC880_14600 [Bacteroidia bacterium]|nr:hypothetical protein [Bacteroidia bacterium]